MPKTVLFPALAVLTLAAVAGATALPAPETYAEEVARWRAEREEGLKADGGWLSLAGLYWLAEGENTVGTGATNTIVLPAGSGPERVGILTRAGKSVTLTVAPGVAATRDGQTLTGTLPLKTDADGKPDRVRVGGLTLTIIVRGSRVALRLYDDNAKTRTGFTGLKWFPVNESYRVEARFVPYDPPRKVSITNILGDTEEATSPGYVVFTLNDKEYRLETEASGSRLFINFKDRTNGDATYPAGRFLYADRPVDGRVTLDFNRAYNPPCAFTDYATCPLPPRANHLDVAIPAGEKRYSEKH